MVKTVSLFNAKFSKAILDFISYGHNALFVIILHKQLKYSTFSGYF
jgi:hypothetical protein